MATLSAVMSSWVGPIPPVVKSVTQEKINRYSRYALEGRDTGNIHTEAATFRSILLGSRDDGKSWSEPFERLRGGTLEILRGIIARGLGVR